MKVMTRLQNITYLQTLLERALAGVFLIQQLKSRCHTLQGHFFKAILLYLSQEHPVMYHPSLTLMEKAQMVLHSVPPSPRIRQRKVTASNIK